MKNLQRRQFLKKTVVAGGGLSLAASTLASNHALAGLVEEDLPYYRANVPFKTNLSQGYAWGTSLTLEGKVYQADGKTPLPGAIIETWHCDEKGRFHTSADRFRGKAQANQKGAYQFKTILPGRYTEKGMSKMSRIFFKVKADGYKSQFSQLYFDSTYHAFIDGEHWAQSPIGKLGKLPFTEKSGNQYITTYDHALEGSSLFSDLLSNHPMESVNVYPNPAKDKVYIKTSGALSGDFEVKVIDTMGRLLDTRYIREQERAAQTPLLVRNLSPGNYLLKIRSSSLGEVTRKLKIIQ